MAYKDDRPIKDENGRTSGEPHPDAFRNLEYTLYKLKEVDLGSTVEVKFFDCNDQGIINDPKYVGFYWEMSGSKYGHPHSFHQPIEKFNAGLNNILNWFVANGHAKRLVKGSMNYAKR